MALERDGNDQAARWCAGCHDPVPFFSGEFDDPNYDDVNNPTSQAGITCTACHAITHVNSTRGNADYTIEEPSTIPFAFSDNPILQWVNNHAREGQARVAQEDVPEAGHQGRRVLLDLPQGRPAVRAEPLQGFRPRAEPLRHLPALRRLRARSAQLLLPAGGEGELRRVPHGPLASSDFGAKDFDGKGGREIHNHLFLGANTGAGRPSRATTRRRRGRTRSSSRTRRSASTSSASAKAARSTASCSARSGPRSRRSKPGKQVPGRGRRADARPRPPVHARGRSTPTRSGSS